MDAHALVTRLPRKLLLAVGVCLFLALAPGAAAYNGSMTIHATKRDVLYGRSTVLTGRLVDANGAPVGNTPVFLQSSAFPYKQPPSTAGGTFTNAQGLYVFEVKPELNTRYSVSRVHLLPPPVEATGPRSRKLLIAVYPYPHFSLRTKGHLVLAHYRLKFSPTLPTPIDHRPVTWYGNDGSSSRWRTIAHGRTREIKPGTIRTGLRHRLGSAAKAKAYRVNACIDFPKHHDVGFGRPTAHPKNCPRHGY